ncbi:hypothetical protein M3Y98_00901400 [Aphelenchoides besseyi]|nr:hypothetical protein M3Y98_00901400 [Aphelenchoides besseyi]
MADDGACPLPRKKPRLKVRTKLNPFTRDLFFEHFIRDNFMSDAAFRIVATSREFVDSARRIASKGVDFRWDVDRIEPTYGVTPFFSFFHDQNMTAAFLELIQPRVKDVVINFESDKPEELSPRILQRLVGAIRLEIDYYREQWEERASRGDWFPMIGRLFQTIGPSLISLDCPANHLALRDGVQPMSIEFLRLQCVSTDVCDFDQILTHRCRCLCIDFLEDCRGYRISNFCPLQPSIERLYIYDERFNIRYFPPSLFSRLPEIQTIAYHYCPERNAYDNDQRNHMSVIFSIQSFSFFGERGVKTLQKTAKDRLQLQDQFERKERRSRWNYSSVLRSTFSHSIQREPNDHFARTAN